MEERRLKPNDKPIRYNQVYYKDAKNMKEIPDASVHLVLTSPPYFNIKDYSKDGRQDKKITNKIPGQIGDMEDYDKYIDAMVEVWKECERVLVPNGKLIINTPLMPISKKILATHHNRHIYNIDSDIAQSVLKDTGLFLYDVYFWSRTNPSKKLMFGSYPYPPNFYAQNTTEFVTVYVKKGGSKREIPKWIKEKSKLSRKEWTECTKQIWYIPVPNQRDRAYGKHCAIMPIKIARRCIKLFTFVGDVVLDPFAGSGTTLKAAMELDRKYVGYEIVGAYEEIIKMKIKGK